MSGIRLIVGIILMGIVLPVILFLLLELHTLSQFLTVAGSTFVAWGVADLLSSILERPRLGNRSPGEAIRDRISDE